MGMTLSNTIFKVKKLDGRFAAYPHFSYYIEEKSRWIRAGIDPLKDRNFFTVREWFWTNLGPSKEYRYWKAHKDPNVITADRSNNDQWCWDTEFGNQRIYVTPMALTYFNLQWM